MPEQREAFPFMQVYETAPVFHLSSCLFSLFSAESLCNFHKNTITSQKTGHEWPVLPDPHPFGLPEQKF